MGFYWEHCPVCDNCANTDCSGPHILCTVHLRASRKRAARATHRATRRA